MQHRPLPFRLPSPQVCSDHSFSNDARHFLDTQQYNTHGILRYERIFGPGFVSTGGAETTKVDPLLVARIRHINLIQ